MTQKTAIQQISVSGMRTVNAGIDLRAETLMNSEHHTQGM